MTATARARERTKVLYLDTSVLLAIALEERGWEEHVAQVEATEVVVSSPLLDAELRSALAREGLLDRAADFVDAVQIIRPDRPLSDELDLVLSRGWLRGADLHHVATALYLSGEVPSIGFWSLDRRQSEVAASAGLVVIS